MKTKKARVRLLIIGGLLVAAILFFQFGWMLPDRTRCEEVSFAFHKSMLMGQWRLAQSLAKPELSSSIQDWIEHNQSKLCSVFDQSTWRGGGEHSFYHCYGPRFTSEFFIRTDVQSNQCFVTKWEEKERWNDDY